MQFAEVSFAPSRQNAHRVHVFGRVVSPAASPIVIFWAASPPHRGYSFSGSGLPFPSSEYAYENTPNKGVAHVNPHTGAFSFEIDQPSGFYAALGTMLLPPHVNLQCSSAVARGDVFTLVIGGAVPFRSIAYHEHNGATADHYQRKHSAPCATDQHAVLRNCGYPTKAADSNDFWGKCPPNP